MKIRHIIYGLLIIVAVLVLIPSGAIMVFGPPKSSGEFGDTFGAVNALFSGLALIGVVVAIFLQQKELNLSTQELRNSARALSRQVELSADTARMQVLPVLIDLQKDRIRTYGGSNFTNFKDYEFTEEYLLKQLSKLKSNTVSLPPAIENLKKQLAEIPSKPNIYGEDPDRDTLDRELRDKEEQLAISTRVAPHFSMLLEYMAEMSLLYTKMKNTKLEQSQNNN